MVEKIRLSEEKKTHRLPLVMPLELFEDLKEAAAKKDKNASALMRSFAKLGLDIISAEETGGGLLIRRGDEITEYKIIW